MPDCGLAHLCTEDGASRGCSRSCSATSILPKTPEVSKRRACAKTKRCALRSPRGLDVSTPAHTKHLDDVASRVRGPGGAGTPINTSLINTSLIDELWQTSSPPTHLGSYRRVWVPGENAPAEPRLGVQVLVQALADADDLPQK